LQTVPAEATGGAATYHSRANWHAGGADVHYAEGFSRTPSPPECCARHRGARSPRIFRFQPHRRSGDLFLGARYQSADRGQRFFSPSAGAAAGEPQLISWFGLSQLRADVERTVPGLPRNVLRAPTKCWSASCSRRRNRLTRDDEASQYDRVPSFAGGLDHECDTEHHAEPDHAAEAERGRSSRPGT
jgi:hypothetical protein